MSDALQKECSGFCFAEVLQMGLDEVKTHYIRKSRFEKVSGGPDYLYTIPEFHGGADDIMVPVENAHLNYAYCYFHLV